MVRIKYGRNPGKIIYIAPNSEDEKTWKEIVDHANEAGEGVGAILMECWRQLIKLTRGK